MLSKKIELPAGDMAQAIDLAKEQQLELIIDKLSCEEDCVARILYKNTRNGYVSLLKLMLGIHALEVAKIRRAMPAPLNLHLLTSKKQNHENKGV